MKLMLRMKTCLAICAIWLVSACPCIFASDTHARVVSDAATVDSSSSERNREILLAEQQNGWEATVFRPGTYAMHIPVRPPCPHRGLGQQVFNVRMYDTQGTPHDVTFQGNEVARHHVIPQITLRRFYNTVVENGHIHHIAQFFENFGLQLGYYAQNNGRPAGDACSTERGFNLIYNAGNLALAVAEGGVIASPTIIDGERPLGFDVFSQYYIWLPGNIFLGPSPDMRTDNPGEGEAERNAATVLGGDHYNILMQLDFFMNAYINRVGDLYEVMRIINDFLLQLTRYVDITPFDGNGWIYLGDNKYRLRTSGEKLSHNNNINTISDSSRVFDEDSTCSEIHLSYEACMYPYYSLITAYNPDAPGQPLHPEL